MSELPVFNRTVIPDADNDPCKGCPIADDWDADLRCKQVKVARYDAEGVVAEVDDPVELMVVADPPSKQDEHVGRFWGDRDGREILEAIKATGAKSFVVVPAVRCYPGAQVDHFILKKKYRNERRYTQETGLDAAMGAVEHCREYVKRARSTYRPKRTLAMGALATKALFRSKKSKKTGKSTGDANVIKLRSRPIHPNRGIRAASKNEGTIVTWDRAYARVSHWAAEELFRDIEERLPSIRDTGFATPRGDDSTIKQVVLDTVDKVRKFVNYCFTSKEIRRDDFLCFDFEAENLDHSTETNRLLNVGFTFKNRENESWIIPFAHPETPFSTEELEEVYGLMRTLFMGIGARFFGYLAHNAQFETAMVKLFFDVWIGEAGNKPIFDSLLMAYTHNENRHKKGIKSPYGLETLAREYLGFRWYEETGIKTKRDRLSSEPLWKVNQYVGMDSAVTARLVNYLMERMKEEGSLSELMRVHTYLYSEAILYTVDLQLTGQVMDADLLRILRGPESAIGPRLEEIRQIFQDAPEVKIALAKINKAKRAGKKQIIKTSASAKTTRFDLNSDPHRKALFWDVLKLKGADESVDKKFQEKYAASEPLVALFQEYQALSTLEGLFLEPIANYLMKSGDGRLHPSFNLSNTASGRLSATKPNTQQVPRGDTRDKKQIKSLYTVPPGKIMVQLDFSQAEVRWLGILSGDKNLAKRYKTAMALKEALRKDPENKELQRKVKIEGDLHMSTAIDMYKLNPDDCIDPKTGDHTPEAKLKRQAAKAVCFGLIYGKHFKSLAVDLGIEPEEAQEAVDLWMSQFPQAAEWLKNVDETIGDSCVSISPFGRWRRLPEAAALDVSVQNRAKRQARNTPIQSAASDFCIYAACQLRKALRNHPDPRLREQTKLINTVHDSLGAEVPADPEVLWEYMNLGKKIFTDPHLIEKHFGVVATVPLEVDFDIGLNWGNVQGCEVNRDDIAKVLHDAEVLRAQPTGTLLKDLKGKGLLYDELDKPKAKKRKRAATGDELKEEGQEQVAANNKAWVRSTLKLARRYIRLRDRKGLTTFNVDKFHTYAEKKGHPEPAHHNAWGALPKRLAKAGLIESTDRVVKAKRPDAHSRKVAVWKIVPQGTET